MKKEGKYTLFETLSEPTAGTRFCNGSTGFSVCSATAEELRLYMLNKEGKVLYTVERKK